MTCTGRLFHIFMISNNNNFVSNDVIRSRMGQQLLSDTIRQRRLSFFGHLCCADIGQDHSRALRTCIRGPPKDWWRRTGRPRQTWLRTVEDDLCPLNFGLATARRRAMDRPAWHLLVDVATSSWHAPERERERTIIIIILLLLLLFTIICVCLCVAVPREHHRHHQHSASVDCLMSFLSHLDLTVFTSQTSTLHTTFRWRHLSHSADVTRVVRITS